MHRDRDKVIRPAIDNQSFQHFKSFIRGFNVRFGLTGHIANAK